MPTVASSPRSLPLIALLAASLALGCVHAPTGPRGPGPAPIDAAAPTNDDPRVPDLSWVGSVMASGLR
jgi:hypothetical protein